MRFHVLGLAHTQTTCEFVHCAYTQKVVKFCRMMMARGHEVYLYASEENEAPCTELIPCITRNEQRRLAGMDTALDYCKAGWHGAHWSVFNGRAIAAITERAQPQDFLCMTMGGSHWPVAQAHPALTAVETGIGYKGVIWEDRVRHVFESYAVMHALMGFDRHVADFDTVIPNAFDPTDFPFSDKPGDYLLFVGRLGVGKGEQIAADVAERLGERLIVAGPGTPPAYGEYVGPVDAKRRGELMAGAKALMCPTQYLGPFEGVHVESMLCGTPVICSDYGVFTETVADGMDGFRCRSLQDYMDAVQSASMVDSYQRRLINQMAENRFSLEKVGERYETYFEKLLTLWGDGWYTTRKES